MDKGYRLSKALTANDLGITGGHQAGIHIPKNKEYLDFFPSLDQSQKNPRTILTVQEKSSGQRWEFNYIYYNGKQFGDGTRDEYRITGMTQYLRQVNAGEGDRIFFEKGDEGTMHIWCERAKSQSDKESEPKTIINISTKWRIEVINHRSK